MHGIWVAMLSRSGDAIMRLYMLCSLCNLFYAARSKLFFQIFMFCLSTS